MISTLSAEFTITEWPDNGEPKVIAGPYIQPIQIGKLPNGAPAYCPVPLKESAWDQLCVQMDRLVPAQPGWVAGTARLTSASGQQLGSQQPICFYGRKSDVGTYLYFAETWNNASYSVQIRIVSGSIDE